MAATVKVLENGPLMVSGECEVTDAQGTAIAPKANPFYLCRCGSTANKPFCDGAHKKVGFKS